MSGLHAPQIAEVDSKKTDTVTKKDAPGKGHPKNDAAGKNTRAWKESVGPRPAKESATPIITTERQGFSRVGMNTVIDKLLDGTPWHEQLADMSELKEATGGKKGKVRARPKLANKERNWRMKSETSEQRIVVPTCNTQLTALSRPHSRQTYDRRSLPHSRSIELVLLSFNTPPSSPDAVTISTTSVFAYLQRRPTATPFRVPSYVLLGHSSHLPMCTYLAEEAGER
jgi:hypothetical protein